MLHDLQLTQGFRANRLIALRAGGCRTWCWRGSVARSSSVARLSKPVNAGNPIDPANRRVQITNLGR